MLNTGKNIPRYALWDMLLPGNVLRSGFEPRLCLPLRGLGRDGNRAFDGGQRSNQDENRTTLAVCQSDQGCLGTSQEILTHLSYIFKNTSPILKL